MEKMGIWGLQGRRQPFPAFSVSGPYCSGMFKNNSLPLLGALCLARLQQMSITNSLLVLPMPTS